MAKTILILGGGMGGVVAANELRKKLSAEHKVVLIDRSDSHFFYPSLFWILEGQRTPEQISRKFDRLKRKGIEWHRSEVAKIDLAAGKVAAGGAAYSYDYLIIALGAELNYQAVTGIEAEQCLYELPGILKTREKLAGFTGGKVAVVIASKPYRCPAAPYEAALLLHALFKKKGIRAKVDLRIFTVEEAPLEVAGPKIGAAVRGMIESQGIKYQTRYKLVSVDKQKREIAFENGEKYSFDLLLVVPPHKAPDVVKEAGLLGENGWIPVNPETLETKQAGVFAVGDVTGIKLPNGKALPKAGVFAHFEAEVVAARIAAEIQGRTPTRVFKGGGSCFMETGDGRAGLAFGNFYARPDPRVMMLPPLRLWHWVKIIFEKWWLGKWF